MVSTDILQEYEGEEVILLGETHGEDSHTELEEEAIYRTQPRYVLYEGLNEADPEELDELIDKMDRSSLRELQEYFEDKYADSEFLADDTRELYEEARNLAPEEDRAVIDNGKFPESYEEFMEMPFFRMDEKVSSLIQRRIQGRCDYEMEEWEKWMGDEMPEGIEDQKIQELFDIGNLVVDLNHSTPNSEGTFFRTLNHLRQEGYATDLAGCDIDKRQEYFDESGVGESEETETLEGLERGLELAEEGMKEEERSRRDLHMAQRISQFSQRNNSERPLLAVVGSSHLEGVSENLSGDISVYTEDLGEIAEPEQHPLDGLFYIQEIGRELE